MTLHPLTNCNQVVVANWVAHQIHHEGVYESELERIGNLYFLRDEPPHRCF